VKTTNTLCWQNADFLYVQSDGVYSYYWAVNG